VDVDLEGAASSTAEMGITRVENEVIVTGIGRVQVPNAVKPWGRLSYNSDHVHAQVWGAGRNSLTPQVSLSTGLPLHEESFIGQADLQYRFSSLEQRLFVVMGASHRYLFVDTDGTLTLAAHHDNTSGLYTQVEYRLFEDLKAVVAGRWDRSTLHASQVSPKVAAVWTPFPGHSLRATFNKAFQAPNYSELFLNVKHPFRNLVYFGNEDVIVEKITGYEIGYRGVVAGLLYFSFDGYYNQLRDFITDLVPGVNPKYPGQITLPGETITRTVWSYGNAGKVKEFGFEMGADYFVFGGFQLTANYAYFDFDVQERSANDALLPNAPRHKLNGGVTYRADYFDVAIGAKYVPSFEWAAGIFKGRILAYTLVNLDASYRITDQLELGVNVTNLFDRQHYQIFGGSLIGRRALVRLTAAIE
jgi:outer membrane receptor protein involved in Fe transport